MSAKCDKQKSVNRNGKGKGKGGEGDFTETILESRETELVTVTSFTKSPGCLADDGGREG